MKENFPFIMLMQKNIKAFSEFFFKRCASNPLFNEGAYQGKMAGQIDEDELEEKIAEILDEV